MYIAEVSMPECTFTLGKFTNARDACDALDKFTAKPTTRLCWADQLRVVTVDTGNRVRVHRYYPQLRLAL